LVTFGKQGFGFWRHLGLGLLQYPNDLFPLNRLLFMFCSFFQQNFSYVTSPFWGSGHRLQANADQPLLTVGQFVESYIGAVALTPQPSLEAGVFASQSSPVQLLFGR
jgi:hypothetical protein